MNLGAKGKDKTIERAFKKMGTPECAEEINE
jgi:hypothetical protein